MNLTLPPNFNIAILLTTFAGLATLLGGCITFFVKKDDMRVLSVGLGFSAGVMIFLSFTDILGEARALLSPVFPNTVEWFVLIGFTSGILIAMVIDYFIPDHIESDMLAPKAHHHNANADESEKANYIKEDHCPKKLNKCCPKKPNKHIIKRAGIFTAVAIALHNFPEGMATFFVTTQNVAVGASLALAIALHNIPEGIAVALPIYHATGKRRTAIFYSFLAGISEPIGALLGMVVINLFFPEVFIGFLCAAVAGIMIYISFDTLLPLSREYGDWHLSITGIITGILVIWTSLLILG